MKNLDTLLKFPDGVKQHRPNQASVAKKDGLISGKREHTSAPQENRPSKPSPYGGSTRGKNFRGRGRKA